MNNEAQLKQLIQKCHQFNLAITVFREPDIGNAITAIAIEPSKVTQKICRNIPLLFKNNNNETEQEGRKRQCENNGYQVPSS